jgi:L-ribulose-5-phosphate 3-epimerase
MKLSTAINFFIHPANESFEVYRQDLRRFASFGFTRLNALFCAAGEVNSPLQRPDWQDWAKVIREESDALGIRFDQLHLPFYNFCSPFSGVNDGLETAIRKSVMCASILNAPWVVAHPATAVSESLIATESLNRNLAYFEPHLVFAASHGVGICLENMCDKLFLGLRRSYCTTVEELCILVDTLAQNHSNIGVCWDFGHANLTYTKQAPCLEYLGRRLKVTHAHDNRGHGDDHLPPLLGTIEWPPIMSALSRIGYDGDFSLEVRRPASYVPMSIRESMLGHLKLVGDFLLTMA